MPIDAIDFTMQLDEEISKIQIKLWPDGLRSIEEAWDKLFDLDIKYKTIQLKPKKTIRILANNIWPKETSRILIASMSTGTQRDQKMASDMMLFHKRLVEIAKAIKFVSSHMELAHSKGTSNQVLNPNAYAAGKPGPKRPPKVKSAAEVASGMDQVHIMELQNALSNIHLQYSSL